MPRTSSHPGGQLAPQAATVSAAAPRHVELARQVREQVRSGALKPGDRLPSFAEMRARLGVSQDTWERMHRLLEQEGLVVRERRRGTFVAPAKPAYPQTGVLGFLSGTQIGGTEDTSPYWVSLLQGVQNAAFRHGFEVLLLHPKSAIRWERLDGVLMTEHEFDRMEAVPPGMCAVSLLVETDSISCVVPDNFRATYDLTAHLLACGHSGIGFYHFALSLDSAQRLDGYRAALQAAGVPFRPELVRLVHLEEPRQSFHARGRLNMELWLGAGWAELGATAILAHNDEFALGVLETLAQHGLRVPQDIQVTGFDGLQGTEFHRANLTTAVVPLREIGMAGVELLMEQMQGHLQGHPQGDSPGDSQSQSQRSLSGGPLCAAPRKLVLPATIRLGMTTGPLRAGENETE